jgi:hypothetical protein
MPAPSATERPISKAFAIQVISTRPNTWGRVFERPGRASNLVSRKLSCLRKSGKAKELAGTEASRPHFRRS